MTNLLPKTHNGRPLKDLKHCYIDFEFNKSSERYMNLVSAAWLSGESHSNVWLHNSPSGKATLREMLLEMRDTHVFVAFNVGAEASSFIALKLDPTKFAWIDLQLEYKMLLNHWHKYTYGQQLIKGKKRRTKPPGNKYEMTEEQRKAADNSKPEKSLASACYKMLGVEIDTGHKNEMRDLIISGDQYKIEESQADILEYNRTDVVNLPLLYTEIIDAYKSSAAKRDIKLSEIFWRGHTAARTAMIEKTGYPVNPTKVKNFSKSVPKILSDIAEDINEQFPDGGFFQWDRARGRYTMKQKPLRDFIKTTPFAGKWQKTKGGQDSLSLEAWQRHYHCRHSYERGKLPDQIIRFLKTKQNLNGFLPAPKGSGRKTFFNAYGGDGRARAWLNPYGAQSSRFQPSATGFIPLKSAWMRSMIEPKPGFSICGIDYGSEEFLLAALLSKDKKMYQSYASGDPYLSFAKKAGAVPKSGTRSEYAVERLRFKSTVLGVGYLMAKYSLAGKLTDDTGVHHTPEDAEKLINLYFEVYSGYASWIESSYQDYRRKGYLKLPDGWIMFGDNPNHRSVSNCPVQGLGGCVLRKAIELSQLRGLRVIIPLHDAIYIEYPTHQPEKIDILYDAMKEAFRYYFQEDEVVYGWSDAIRLDVDVWGPDQKEGTLITPAGREAKSQKIYIDPRGKEEYERFSRYF